MTTVGWVDLYTRKEQKLSIVESLNYCIAHKGLIVYAYCIMPSHIHAICRADEGIDLSDILRDLKKHTSKQAIATIKGSPESRREWLLRYFENAGKHLARKQDFKVWQDGNTAKEIYSEKFLYEKLDYIHNNPVEDMIVANPEEYIFSSAIDYAGGKGLVKVQVLDSRPMWL